MSILLNYKLNDRFKEGDEPNDMDYPILEILLYNLRHTQHHTAQLNMLLRHDIDKHMEWSFKVGDINNKTNDSEEQRPGNADLQFVPRNKSNNA